MKMNKIPQTCTVCWKEHYLVAGSGTYIHEKKKLSASCSIAMSQACYDHSASSFRESRYIYKLWEAGLWPIESLG